MSSQQENSENVLTSSLLFLFFSELHKQHQDKLEDITGRFDSIKLTLSEKVETLRSECDRLRDRARSCEDALQRDSDYKVQVHVVMVILIAAHLKDAQPFFAIIEYLCFFL